MPQYSVSIIGSGNVATQLALTLYKNGVNIKSVYARHIENANALAKRVDAAGVDDYTSLDVDVDFLILAVKDDAIETIVKKLPKALFVLHTSGSIPMEVLDGFESFGILYPLQTFSKEREMDLSVVPFFIESNQSKGINEIKAFVKAALSDQVYVADSRLRKVIHLAAVFANNFTTQLMVEAAAILETEGLDISIFKPLMAETFDKIFEQGALNALTGPAKRNDTGVIEGQIAALETADLKEIYALITRRIQAQFKT